MTVFYEAYRVNLTNAANVFTADAAEALAIEATYPSDEGLFNSYYTKWVGVDALGGDDVVHRDRTGGYAVGLSDFLGSFQLNGGSGSDTVSYQLATMAVSASLAARGAQLQGGLFDDDVFDSIENLTGTHYDDTLIGDGEANVLKGLNGDDVIDGEAGNDRIEGGKGEDHLVGDLGNDTILGGDDGDDIWGDGGNDVLRGDGGADLIYGGDGADDIEGGSGADTIEGGSGNDTIKGGGDGDDIEGGSGNDDIDGGGGGDTMDGGLGADMLRLDGNDVAYGGFGHDTFVIGSGWGDNFVDGGSGNDRVVYTGSDDVQVFLFDDRATRGFYEDTLLSIRDVKTAGGDDLVFGSTGYNRIETGDGADTIYTLGGNDYVNAGSGSDVVVGYGGNETIDGGSGNDFLYGNGGGDKIDGGANNDLVDGGAGDDTLGGGSGNDVVIGGEGYDQMAGGSDVDTFVWNHGDTAGFIDVISDFNGWADRFAFGEGFFELNPTGVTPLSDVLNAYNGWGGTIIEARAADGGWAAIAVVTNPGQTAAIQARIASGGILDVAVDEAFDGAPGGFSPVQGAGQSEMGLQFFF